VALDEEDASLAIWLPIQSDELSFLQNALRSAGVIVPGNYEGSDPCILIEYLSAATIRECEFHALFDRNLISPLVSLARGESVPESQNGQSSARLAAACACFCILANILIEPNISIYEYAASSGNSAAQSDVYFFRLADNTDARAFLEIALGNAHRLPHDMLERIRSLPNFSDMEISEKNFERKLSSWKPSYLFALKTAALRRSGLKPVDAALALTKWQEQDAFFFAPASMYCLAAISHTPPKGGMLKGIQSENLSLLRSGLRNAAWDICLLQQFGKLVQRPNGPLWSLWSTDVALREIAISLFLRDDESERNKLINFYSRHWGERDGNRLLAAYDDSALQAGKDKIARQAKTNETIGKLNDQIEALEHELGLFEG
jgi:hypothetical protein